MILRSAALLTIALGLRILLSVLPALGGALVLPMEEVADVTLALAIVTPFFLASAMGIPQRVSTGDYGAGRYDQLHVARLLLGVAALPVILIIGLGFPMVASSVFLAFFLSRLFEGQAEVSTAILTRQDKAVLISVIYGAMVAVFVLGLFWISNRSDGRLDMLLGLTVATSLASLVALHFGARRFHDRGAIQGRLLSRSLFEIRKGYSLGLADGVLSLVSYLPRYLLTAIGLHLAQGAFAIAQLLIRQFTIPMQGLLFAGGGRLLPHKGSDRGNLDRFLFNGLASASAIGFVFAILFLLVRDQTWFLASILSELGTSQMILSIFVGAVFLLRFATWLIATRFLKGAQQLRIAAWSGVIALATAALLFISQSFEAALATDFVANLVIVGLARHAMIKRVSQV